MTEESLRVKHNNCDVAIVGGGMMGSTLALTLAQALPSSRIVICDQHALAVERPANLLQASFDERSTALSPTTIELLIHLGVWSKVQGGKTAIQEIHVSDRGHLGAVKLTEQDNELQPLGYVVENRSLGWALTESLLNQSNIQVLAPQQVDAIKLQANCVELFDSAHKPIIQAQLAIIADGADSPLRQRLGMSVQVKDYRQSAIVANVKSAQPHGGRAFERFTEQGPLALLPLQGARGQWYAMVWTWPEGQVHEAMAFSDEELLIRLRQVIGDRAGRFTEVTQRHAYPLRLVVAQEQVRRRVCLMGNAAHFLHPVAGQGYNLAVRDGLRLAEVLSKVPLAQIGDLSVLQTYESLQEPDQFRTLFLSDGFNRWFANRNPAKVVMRNIAMSAVQTVPSLRELFIRQMSGRASAKAHPWS